MQASQHTALRVSCAAKSTVQGKDATSCSVTLCGTCVGFVTLVKQAFLWDGDWVKYLQRCVHGCLPGCKCEYQLLFLHCSGGDRSLLAKSAGCITPGNRCDSSPKCKLCDDYGPLQPFAVAAP